jgi:hypothetical protein
MVEGVEGAGQGGWFLTGIRLGPLRSDPRNSHTSFTLSSGTAGLQEAITAQLQSTPAFVVVLDKYWYQLVAACRVPISRP